MSQIWHDYDLNPTQGRWKCRIAIWRTGKCMTGKWWTQPDCKLTVNWRQKIAGLGIAGEENGPSEIRGLCPCWRVRDKAPRKLNNFAWQSISPAISHITFYMQKSLEFTINRVLMKIFQTKSMDTTPRCRWYFGITDTK